MFKELFKYDLKYSFKIVSTHIFFGVMFLLAFVITINEGATFSGVDVSVRGATSAIVFVNSPYNIHQIVTMLAYVGLIFIAAIAARIINRDYEYGTNQWFYSLPLKKADFVFGRFMAALTVILYIFAAVPLGMYIGSVMPFMNPDRFCPNEFMNYFYPFITSVLPYTLATLSFLMGLSLYFKNTLILTIGTIILLVTYTPLYNMSMTIGLDGQYWVALFDPISLVTLDYFTKYLTIAEKNGELIQIAGVYLYNRIFVLGLTAGLFAFAYRKFDFGLVQSSSKQKAEAPENEIKRSALPSPVVKSGFEADLKKYFSLTMNNFLYVIKSGPFLFIFIFWNLLTVIQSPYIGMRSETSVYFVTHIVSEFLYGNMFMFALAIVTIYSGEVIWRERDKKFNEFFNALPVSTSIIFAAKLSSILILIYSMMASNIILGVIIQLLHGYYNFEIGLYFKYFMIFSPVIFTFIALLFFVIHVIVNNKYFGYTLVVLYYLSTEFTARLDFSHPLYLYGWFSPPSHSDINGFGYIGSFFVLSAYWLFFIAMLLLTAKFFWVRGIETGFKQRINIFLSQLNKKAAVIYTVLGLGFVGLGSYIFYNMNILNKYETNAEQEKNAVQYEKDYKKYERSAQPSIIDTKVQVDIYPERREVLCSGIFKLKNMTDSIITGIHIVSARSEDYKYTFSTGAELTDSCKYKPYNIYKLKSPVFPGDSLQMNFTVKHLTKGFKGGGAYYNGTFLNNSHYFPIIGYSGEIEMTDIHKRKKYGLPPKERMASINDPFEIYRNYVGNASWTKFEAVVSTSSDQVAIAPGRLVNEWKEGDRNFFHYKADADILNFF
ncbi:MAG: ABC transporter permease, partial [Candidatus Delongbacteria bacterium]|nr:ABC transporter permease [Candidatus Delongbacteria bacterium]